MAAFDDKLSELWRMIVDQSSRVVDITQRAAESFFGCDHDKADRVIDDDLHIDRVDVQVEQTAVPTLALPETDHFKIRSVLAIVKINNELERIANRAVNIAESAKDFVPMEETPPDTFRVMANSVIGIVQDTDRVIRDFEFDRAERVLNLQDTVERFTREIGQSAERRVANGEISVQFAMCLRSVTKSLERITDHCCNICEQLIYLNTGKITRHSPEGWTKPAPPTF